MKNLYDILQVSENASDEVIEKAYKTLVKKYHPDLQPKEKKQVAEAMMKSLNEAYETLSDPEKRKRYDEEYQQQKRIQEEEKYQKFHQAQQENVSSQRTVSNQEMTKQEPETQTMQDENLVEYMGDMVKNAFSSKRRQNTKIKRAYQDGYQDAYREYWTTQGYTVKEPWSWKRVKEVLKSVLIFSAVLLFIWFFPPTHNMLVSIYEDNEILRNLIDFVVQFFGNFFRYFGDALLGR